MEIAGCRLDRCHARQSAGGYLVSEEEVKVATGWNLDSAGCREIGFDSGKEWAVRKGSSSGDGKRTELLSDWKTCRLEASKEGAVQSPELTGILGAIHEN